MTDSNPFHSGKIKIALVCDWCLPKMGGTEMHLRDLAERLSLEGHEVHVITPFPGHERGERIKIHRLKVPLLTKFNLIFTPSAIRKLEDILKENSFDIVHCHAHIISLTAYMGVYLGKKLRIPTVITWDYSIVGVHRWGLAFLERIFHWSEWPVLFSGVSEGVVRDVRSLLKNKKVFVLHKALDVFSWKVTPVKRDSLDVWIVSVMPLNGKERGKALISIIPEVLKRIPGKIRIKFKIIGMGPKRNSLERHIKRLGLESIVEFQEKKTRDEIRKVFAQTDIYFQPSRWESFGPAVPEARCAGLPVVAKRDGEINGFIRYGQEGLLAESDKELEDHLVRLILDPELRESIARHNREVAPQDDWKKSLNEHEALYREAIALMKTFGDEKDNGRKRPGNN